MNLSLGIVVVCAGFFLVYFVEEVAHFVADRHAHNRTDVTIHRAVSVRGCSVSLQGPSSPCDPCSYQDGDEACLGSTISQRERNDYVDKEYCRKVKVTTDENSSSRNDLPKRDDDKLTMGVAHSAIIDNHGTDCYGTFKNTHHNEPNGKVDVDHGCLLQVDRGSVHFG